MSGRYLVGYNVDSVVVIDTPHENYTLLSTEQKQQHTVARFNTVGIMTRALATHYAYKLAQQLNDFEAANLAVAKLTD